MPEPLKPNRITLINRCARALWNVVWLLLYRPSPRLLHPWRCILLRLFGAKVGRGVRPYPSARIWAPWNLELGNHACLGDWVNCYCVDEIRIGAHSTISQYSFLCTASHDYSHPSLPLVSAPILVGDHVWITSDVFVAPGVTVGDGAVITARSSVFDDVPAWVVARGNPAAPFKYRHLDGVSHAEAATEVFTRTSSRGS
jgi:putative colanic acid biosynthesis acetyltransferase WcaF